MMKDFSTFILLFLALLFVVFCILGLIGGFFLSGRHIPPINHEQMKEIFNEDYELLVIVRDYFINSRHANLQRLTTHERGEVFSGGIRRMIEDVEVVEAIDLLESRGYSVIGRRGNTIHFLRWSIRNAGRGVVYSIDGSEPTESDLDFLTRLEPLSVPGWYYYEEDVREWRQRNRG